MKLNKMGLATVIKELVRKEVEKVLEEKITQVLEGIDNQTIMNNNTPPKKSVRKISAPNPKNTTLAQVLKETADSGEWRSLGDGPMTTDNMGDILNKQYGDMMNGQVDVATSIAAAENTSADGLPDKLKNALNRDYSELVKTFSDKK